MSQYQDNVGDVNQSRQSGTPLSEHGGQGSNQPSGAGLAQQYVAGNTLQFPLASNNSGIAVGQAPSRTGIVEHILPAQNLQQVASRPGMLQPFGQDEWGVNGDGVRIDPSKVYPAKFLGIVPIARGVFVMEQGGMYSLTDRAIVSRPEHMDLIQVEPGPIRDITASVSARRGTGSREYAFSYPDLNDVQGPPVEFSTTIGIDNCILSYSQNAGRAISRTGPTGQFVSKYMGTYVNLGIPTNIATKLLNEVEVCEGRCGVSTKMNNDPVKDGVYTWVVCKVVSKEDREFELDYVKTQGGTVMPQRLTTPSSLMLSTKKSFMGMASITFRVSYHLTPTGTLMDMGTISPVLTGFQLCSFSTAVKPSNTVSTVTVSASKIVDDEVLQAIRGISVSGGDARVISGANEAFASSGSSQPASNQTQPQLGAQLAQQMMHGTQ